MKLFNHITLITLTLFTLLKVSFNANNSAISPIILKFHTKASINDNYTEANSKSYLYSYITIGSNKQNVEMRIQLSKHSTYIIKKSEVSSLYNTYTYDNTTSTTYKFIVDWGFYTEDLLTASVSNETLYSNDKILENFTFAYANMVIYSSDIPAGLIGFGFNDYSFPFNFNLIDQLKKNDLISGYGLTINFTSRDEGNFIIGPEFDEIDGNDKKYNSTIYYLENPGNIYQSWKMGFNYVSIGEKNLNYSKNAILNIDSDFIFATDEYTSNIYEVFFKNLTDQKKCVSENIINQPDFVVIRCDKDIKIEDFPELKFNLKVYNDQFNFNFTYKDLFELKDNYYYFKILLVYKTDSTIIKSVNWEFGRTFFRTFIVTLNKDKKSITFYTKIDGENNNDGKNNSQTPKVFNMLNIILIIVLVAICVILFLVGFKYWEQNKKIKNRERKNIILDEDDDFVDITKTEKLTPAINES